ncbi:hypothetical protein ACJX0J_041655, partial [Zea mays]
RQGWLELTRRDCYMHYSYWIIAGSLMSGVAGKSINVLFSYVKPAIKDNDSLIQKRAYKVLSMLLKVFAREQIFWTYTI